MSKAKQIVSANYRNRDDKASRWLARNESEGVEAASPLAAVEITDFEFISSTASEAGFGCQTVCVGTVAAACEAGSTVIHPPQLAGEVRLRFESWGGIFWNGSEQVKSGKRLRLLPDGSIFAVLA
ncbi:MAG: hypothetical protein U0744_02490 [Gemmataceae bacterium]